MTERCSDRLRHSGLQQASTAHGRRRLGRAGTWDRGPQLRRRRPRKVGAIEKAREGTLSLPAGSMGHRGGLERGGEQALRIARRRTRDGATNRQRERRNPKRCPLVDALRGALRHRPGRAAPPPDLSRATFNFEDQPARCLWRRDRPWGVWAASFRPQTLTLEAHKSVWASSHFCSAWSDGRVAQSPAGEPSGCTSKTHRQRTAGGRSGPDCGREPSRRLE